MIMMELPNGFKIPAIGYGTATIRGLQCIEAVKNAVDCGYRLIDTASQYKNEEAVGNAIKECGCARSEVFVSSKLWNDAHGYDKTLKAFQETLNWTGLDYLDIYLIHWPNPKALRMEGYEKHNAETWQAMEELYLAGKVKAIGVSNFQQHHLDALIKKAKIRPMINQICLYPGKEQKELVQYCNEKGIVLESYSPLGAGKLLQNPYLVELGSKYGKNPGQIVLRWHIQKRFIPLPRSVCKERMKGNMEIFDFELTEMEMDKLSKLKMKINILPDPDEADF